MTSVGKSKLKCCSPAPEGHGSRHDSAGYLYVYSAPTVIQEKVCLCVSPTCRACTLGKRETYSALELPEVSPCATTTEPAL